MKHALLIFLQPKFDLLRLQKETPLNISGVWELLFRTRKLTITRKGGPIMGHLVGKNIYRELGIKIDGMEMRAPWNEKLYTLLKELYSRKPR